MPVIPSGNDWLWALWIGAGLAAAGFFHGSKNGALKKRVFPYYLVGFGVLSVVVIGGVQPPLGVYTAMVSLVVAGILYANYRQVTFCLTCGQNLVASSPFSPRPKSCPKCGATLAP